MNIYRLIADLLHLLSFFIIIAKLLRTRSCKGVSCKTQEVYLVVFLMRYIDLFMYFVSIYNTTMKILFIFATLFIIYLMRLKSPINCVRKIIKCRHIIEKSMMHSHIIGYSQWQQYLHFLFILNLHVNKLFYILAWEIVWSYSLWLESLAIFPQITILNQNGVEPFTAHYIAALGSYRFFYILNW